LHFSRRSSTDANRLSRNLFPQSWEQFRQAPVLIFEEDKKQLVLMTLLPCKRANRGSESQTSEFEELALPSLPSLHNVALGLSRNTADAEDLVQETFLKAVKVLWPPQDEAG
jgi:sigma-70-like protein